MLSNFLKDAISCFIGLLFDTELCMNNVNILICIWVFFCFARIDSARIYVQFHYAVT